MASLFPGMDPFLEHPLLWPDVHNRLITELANVGRIPGASIPALRIPLAAGLAVEPQVLAWLDCLERNGLLRGRAEPSLAFPESFDETPGNLWVLLRPPRAQDFLMLGADPESLLWPDPDVRPVDEDLLRRRPFLAACERALRQEPWTLARLCRRTPRPNLAVPLPGLGRRGSCRANPRPVTITGRFASE